MAGSRTEDRQSRVLDNRQRHCPGIHTSRKNTEYTDIEGPEDWDTSP